MRELCCYCPQEFSSRSHCQVHEKTHLPWFLWGVVCTICRQRFSSAKKLATHTSTATHMTKASRTLPADLQKLRGQFVVQHRGSPASEKLVLLARQNVVTEDNTINSAAPDTTGQTGQCGSSIAVSCNLSAVNKDSDFELDYAEFCKALNGLDFFMPDNETMNGLQRDYPGTPISDEPSNIPYSPVSNHADTFIQGEPTETLASTSEEAAACTVTVESSNTSTTTGMEGYCNRPGILHH